MSLECAVEIDGLNNGLKQVGKQTPVDIFDANLYRQPALAAEYLVPEKYRNKATPEENSPSESRPTVTPVRKAERARLPSVEGVTMVSTINLMHSDNSPEASLPYDPTRRSGKAHFLFSFSTPTASVDEDRVIATAMETIDEENVEDQIDELLAPKIDGKSFGERSSFFKASAASRV
jgi:hypothetical protein